MCACVCALIEKPRDGTGEGVLRNNGSSGWVTPKELLKDPSDFSHQLKESDTQCKEERGIFMKEEKLKVLFFKHNSDLTENKPNSIEQNDNQSINQSIL